MDGMNQARMRAEKTNLTEMNGIGSVGCVASRVFPIPPMIAEVIMAATGRDIFTR